ncbi:MAG: hypothetical protein H5T69_00665 [Chloroflexi bacterium]|nr:hypothetical protein [Chloroflexota bacterium]
MEEKRRPGFLVLVARLGRLVFSVARDYVLIVRAGSEGKGLAALQRLVRGGPLVQVGLAILAFGVFATAYIGLYGGQFPTLNAELWEGEQVHAPLPALIVSLFIGSFAWAYLLVGAAACGLGAYVVAAAYVAYYGLLAGIALGGTVWFILVPLWLLALDAPGTMAAAPVGLALLYRLAVDLAQLRAESAVAQVCGPSRSDRALPLGGGQSLVSKGASPQALCRFRHQRGAFYGLLCACLAPGCAR